MPAPRNYQREISRILKNINQLDKNTAREVLSDLRQVKGSVLEMLKDTKRFEPRYLNAMLSEIDDKIDFFTSRMNRTIVDSEKEMYKHNDRMAKTFIGAAGVSISVPRLSNAVLIANTKLTGEMISNMAVDMRRDIARSLRRSIVAGEDTYQAAGKLDGIIGTSRNTGYMNRADLIARQEIGRTYSEARQATDELTAENIPDMQKQWWTAQDERVRPMYKGKIYPSREMWDHAAAHGQVVGVNEPFIVSGEELMFPRDSNGSLANILGCRCNSIPYREEWG